jgi:hypothetical protein
MSSVQRTHFAAAQTAELETRDFYLACFLRCTGYELIDLRAEGRRKVFVFRDRPSRLVAALLSRTRPARC